MRVKDSQSDFISVVGSLKWSYHFKMLPNGHESFYIPTYGISDIGYERECGRDIWDENIEFMEQIVKVSG